MASEKLPTSLYDFIFIDRSRVQSLYAQLFSGLLSEIETLATESHDQGHEMKAGGSPVGSFSSTRKKEVSESQSEKTDPHDLILKDVLGGLHDTGFICQDPLKAKPGNIILLKGAVSILDFKLYDNILKLMPSFFELAQHDSGAKNHQTKKARQQAASNQKKMAKTMESVLSGMADMVPWSINVIMQADKVITWGGIQKEHLRDEPGALMQKHGTVLSGDWYMLAIVDAIGPTSSVIPDGFPDFIAGITTIVDSMKDVAGRPDDFMGVTPLLIFRKLMP